MKTKTLTYSKEVIEIADYRLANPNARRGKVLAKFGKEWQIPPRSFDRLWKLAKEYNKERLQEQEKVRKEVLLNHTKKEAEKGLKSREDLLRVYSLVIDDFEKFMSDPNYKLKKAGEDILIPTFSDTAKAGDLMTKMQGWNAAEKIDVKGEINAVFQIVPMDTKNIKTHFANNEDDVE